MQHHAAKLSAAAALQQKAMAYTENGSSELTLLSERPVIYCHLLLPGRIQMQSQVFFLGSKPKNTLICRAHTFVDSV